MQLKPVIEQALAPVIQHNIPEAQVCHSLLKPVHKVNSWTNCCDKLLSGCLAEPVLVTCPEIEHTYSGAILCTARADV
eukprot:3112553-Rhodomonas_salina.7